ESDVAKRSAWAKNIPKDHTVVPFGGLGELWKLAIGPIEISSVDDDTTDGCAMTADPLGGRFHNDIRSMLQRTEQITTGSKGIIDDQRQIMFFGYRTDAFEIRYGITGIPNGFHKYRFGPVVDQFFIIGG